jgi:ubiquinone/menaquinone biosynthesis C-methylase UbiE
MDSVPRVCAEAASADYTEMSFDPEAVRVFEHAGWQQAAAEYDATFAQATAPFVETLLDAAGVVAGIRVLDVCCGTGLVTAAATARGARTIGLDFSPAMPHQARHAHPELQFDEGDAEALLDADDSFDVVVSNFGIHHVPRPGKAIAESFRVLRPGGRVAFTTWAAPAENIAWRLLFDTIREHGDLDAAKTPPSGGNLGTAEAVLRLLGDAGFAAAQAEPIRREWRVDDPHDLFAALAQGTVRTAALIAAQPAAARPAIEAAVSRAAEPHRRGDGFAVPIVAILACGTKSRA